MDAKTLILRELKEQLPYGSMAKIAKEVGLTIATVSRTLNGDPRSPDRMRIIKIACDYLKQHKKETAEVMQAIEELTVTINN